MKLNAAALSPLEFKGGVLVLGRSAGAAPSAVEASIDAALGGALSSAVERQLFKGKPRQSVGLDTHGRLPFQRVLVLGARGRAQERGRGGRRRHGRGRRAESKAHAQLGAEG